MTPALLLIVLVLVAVVACGCLVFVTYHKLSKAIDRIGKDLPRVTGNIITQLEAFAAIKAELGLPHALAQTRGWAASPDFLRTVMDHALRSHPGYIVECSSGTSTVVLARCLQIQGAGHVYSLEHDAEFAEVTRRELRRQGLTEFATVVDAPLREVEFSGWKGQWYSYENLPNDLKIDLLVIDGPPWFVGELPRYPALPALHAKLQPSAAIFLDDAARDAEKASVARWLKEFKDIKPMRVRECEKGCSAFIRTDGQSSCSNN